jgi:hypothetical protein
MPEKVQALKRGMRRPFFRTTGAFCINPTERIAPGLQ